MYQHAILPHDVELQVEVVPEAYQYWTLRYRCESPAFRTKDQWRTVEHLTTGELGDVYAVVLEGFMDDWEAQGLF